MGFPGRPSGYDQKYCEEIIQHGAEGLSFIAFAGKIGVSARTLAYWKHSHKEFDEACEIAEAASQYYWELQGRDGIRSISEKISDPHTGEVREVQKSKIDNAVFIFTMKARFGWKDKVEISGNPDQPVTARLIIQYPETAPASSTDEKAAA